MITAFVTRVERMGINGVPGIQNSVVEAVPWFILTLRTHSVSECVYRHLSHEQTDPIVIYPQEKQTAVSPVSFR